MFSKVRPERTGWRDERISRLHRCWDPDLGLTDIDWVVAEYTRERMPQAVIEYKWHEKALDFKDPQYEVLCRLAERATPGGLFICQYYFPEGDTGTKAFANIERRFTITPYSYKARQFLRNSKVVMTEDEYTKFLRNIRRVYWREPGDDVPF